MQENVEDRTVQGEEDRLDGKLSLLLGVWVFQHFVGMNNLRSRIT